MHITSGFPSVASQCGLQYFESVAAVQLQAGFAHLLFAIYPSNFHLLLLLVQLEYALAFHIVPDLATTMPLRIERMARSAEPRAPGPRRPVAEFTLSIHAILVTLSLRIRQVNSPGCPYHNLIGILVE